ncbi:MAG TPA: hypothetical protein DEP85_02005 [Holosporales bacterium]|nr:hypothetical protein [Holosporales bacterium]
MADVTSKVITLDHLAQRLDPVLYAELASLNTKADLLQLSRPDSVLDDENWATLISSGISSEAARKYLTQSYEYFIEKPKALNDAALAQYVNFIENAHGGMKFAARGSLNRAISDSTEEPGNQIYLSERLIWLEVYCGNWEGLNTAITQLTGIDVDNPYLDYGLAIYLSHSGKPQEAIDHAQKASQAENLDPVTLVAAKKIQNSLGQKVSPKDSFAASDDLIAYTALLLDNDFKNNWASYLSHSNFSVWESKQYIAALFNGVNPKDFQAVRQRVKFLVRSGQIEKEKIPWIGHLYFRHFLDYQHQETPRVVANSIAEGVYDCSEYTEGLQTLCEDNRLHCKAIIYTDGPETGHAFLAYESRGKWGYASVMSFSNPVFKSKKEVENEWTWDLAGDKSIFTGKLIRGTLSQFSQTSPTNVGDQK